MGRADLEEMGAEAEFRSELSSAAMATAGGASGAGRSWAQLSREEGRSEIELGFDDGLGGGGKERHDDTWAQTPRRQRRGDGGVSSKGRRGAWRAREGAREGDFHETRGTKAGLAEGSARGWPGGRASGETATNGVSRRGREMEMVVMAVL